MSADLTQDPSLPGRLHAWLEHSFAKVFFVTNFMHKDKQAAARVGVSLGPTDYMGAAAAGMLLSARMAAYEVAAHVPVLRDAADRSLVHKLGKQLASYGHAEFTTNADTYRPADAPAHPTTHA
jgi:hypothetical protein